jgi:hypothetical protein
MRRESESTGYFEFFSYAGTGTMVVSICSMAAAFVKSVSADKGMPAAHAEALVAMAGKHAKQTGDHQAFTDSGDRRSARRTGVRRKEAVVSGSSLPCSAPHARVACACVSGGSAAGDASSTCVRDQAWRCAVMRSGTRGVCIGGMVNKPALPNHLCQVPHCSSNLALVDFLWRQKA